MVKSSAAKTITIAATVKYDDDEVEQAISAK